MKKFLLLGGKPIGSLDILDYARNRGAYVIVCDYLDEALSPAKQLADEAWSYSTNDVDTIVNHAKKDGVVCAFTGVHEFNLKKCQQICEQLNIPFYASSDELHVSSQKNIYKAIFRNHGINTIKEYNITLNDIPKNIQFPIIIKPSDGSGAYGINICHNEYDIITKMGDATRYSENKKIIAEHYITDKEEITTVYFIINGIPYLASVADRLVQSFNDSVIPLPVGYIWPSKYLSLYEENVDAKMKNAIQDMGLMNGMLFIQSIVKNGVIYPYDIGFRLSGTQEHIILEEMCGYNPLKLLVDFAFDGNFNDKEKLISKINPHFNGYASNITFLAKTSTIMKFTGTDEVERMDGVIRIIKNKMPGETIPESALGTLNQVALRVFVKADSIESLNSLIANVASTISIEDEHGKNVLIPR